MQSVIVTGGAGFIGSHLCKRLLDEGLSVICIDNLVTSTGENIKLFENNPHFKFIHHDVIKPLPHDLTADFVFHLASPASPNHHSKISYLALPMETMMVNTSGTQHLLEFCAKHNAKFLFASTSEVYGDPLVHPQKEDYRGNVSTTGPRSVYDEAKRFGETIVAHFDKSKNVNTRIVRIFNTYGGHMNKDDGRMVIDFILQALAEKPITVFGDGKQTRSLCYVSDTVDGIFRLMFYPNTRGQIVNIGSPEEHTVLEYAELIKELTHSNSEITFSEKLPQDDPLRRQADISLAKKLLDWEPKVSLKTGLEKMIQYVKEG